jgi:phage repressor protein C with HTH and peptisase S24 domain
MHGAHTWRVSSARPKTKLDKDLTFWERLQKAADYSGVDSSPSSVARELGIGQSAVTKYVQGKFAKRANTNKLAARRKVRSEWLFSGLGNMVAEEALDSDTLELLRLFRLLDDDARGRLLDGARYETRVAAAQAGSKRQKLEEELSRLDHPPGSRQ